MNKTPSYRRAGRHAERRITPPAALALAWLRSTTGSRRRRDPALIRMPL
ncbi:hypothetical protein [Methylomonas methanica]|nr:hypothetical protein [Methylomonas methanica]